jgi:uncharacterized protein (DUF433 family)
MVQFQENLARALLSAWSAQDDRNSDSRRAITGALYKSGREPVVAKDYDGEEGNVMANLDWSQCPAVESVPDRRSGAWVFRGTRMPAATVFENLEAGSSIEEIIEQFHVTREQIQAVLEFAARSLDAPPIRAGVAVYQDPLNDAHPS